MQGARYSLVTILVYVILAKLAGENQPAGIAEWVALRIDDLALALGLAKVRAPHRTTYGRILGHVIDLEDFDRHVAAFFALSDAWGRGYRFKRVVDGKLTHETVYGASSLSADEASAEQLLAYVRTHWQIENGLHCRRDQTLREDWRQGRTGHAAQMLATINNLVTALVLRQGCRNLPQARRRYAAHWQDALNLLVRCPT